MQRRPFGKRKRSASGAVALTAILALVAVSLVIAGGRVFVVHSVVVEGNRFISAEEIMQTGGVSIGDSMFTLDTAAVEEKINAHQYLTCNSVWRDFPDRVFINVTEHQPVATANWMGSLVMLGQDGVVMEITGQIDIELAVPVITGASIKSARVGEAVTYGVAGQAEAVEFLVDAATRHCGQPLKDLKLRRNVLVVSITRGGKTELPNGDSTFQRGDTVIIVTSGRGTLRQINDIFAGKGISEFVRTVNNEDGINKTLEYLNKDFEGICFINLVD